MQKEKSRADDGGILGGRRSADCVHTTLTPVRTDGTRRPRRWEDGDSRIRAIST